MSLVWSDNLVRDRNGKLLGRVCRPTLKTETKQSQHITDFNNLTVEDIKQRQKKRSLMINTVLGK